MSLSQEEQQQVLNKLVMETACPGNVPEKLDAFLVGLRVSVQHMSQYVSMDAQEGQEPKEANKKD